MRIRVWRREVVCQQWVELVTDYLDGALPGRLTRAIDRHLADCEHCREYLAQMQVTIRVASQLPDEAVPDELIAVLERALDDYRADPD